MSEGAAPSGQRAERIIPPFLRWAGSKRQILPKLSEYWDPECNRYVEPFAGSACLFFFLGPPRAFLSDINAHLIETLTSIRDDVEAVIALLANAKREKDLYYHVRSLKSEQLSQGERAAQFIYLNRYCFNGLYRTNLQGHFNVPFGTERTGLLPSAEHLRHCSRLLARAELYAGDFGKALSQVKEGDFVYLDPPYITKARRVFNEYDRTLFSQADVERLRVILESLAERRIPFVLSYTACKEARYLAKGFHVERAIVRRSIAGFAAKRVQRHELLISPKPPHRIASGVAIG